MKGLREMLSYRSKEMLVQLLRSNQPVTIQEMADRFQVSVRTIHYDLSPIREWLVKHQIQLRAQPNKGIWVEGDVKQKQMLLDQLSNYAQSEFYFHKSERRKYLSIYLLSREDSQTAAELADYMKVSRNTLLSDLQAVDEAYQEWNLKLERKVRKGFRVRGSEVNKRLAFEYFFHDVLSSDDMLHLLFNLFRGEKKQWFESAFFHFLPLEKREFEKICQAVCLIGFQAEKKRIPFLSERKLLGIFIRMCIVIIRMRLGQTIDASFMEDRSLPSQVKDVLKNVIADLSRQLDLPFPEEEIVYIGFYLKNNETFSAKTEHSDLDIVQVTSQLLNEMSHAYHLPFYRDFELYNNLLAHLFERIPRSQQGILEPNPLVKEIKQTYSQMFDQLKKVMQKILANRQMVFTDADVAYLVMYFQAAYERYTDHFSFQAVVVCATGRGNAELLKTILENRIRYLQVVESCSVQDVNRVIEQREDIDVVISNLPLHLDIPFVQVHSIPTRNDLQAILNLMEQKRHHRLKTQIKRDLRTHFVSPLRKSEEMAQFPFYQLKMFAKMAEEVIYFGFELGNDLCDAFSEFLTEDRKQGLQLHVLLMANRLAFATPYTHSRPSSAVFSSLRNRMMTRLETILEKYDLTLPDGEKDAILNYLLLSSKKRQRATNKRQEERYLDVYD